MARKYSEEELREHFDCYDLNGNGEISWSELLQAIKRCSGYDEEEVEVMARKILKKCDKNEDSKITFDEFKEGMSDVK